MSNHPLYLNVGFLKGMEKAENMRHFLKYASETFK
jgi:hypothetical protein